MSLVSAHGEVGRPAIYSRSLTQRGGILAFSRPGGGRYTDSARVLLESKSK